ncbi:MAG TPA: hypothetical protein VMW91_03355 [Desulfosporosinus sp.]|nr:hypothetical protein [Desulfosporosinus sp.]
MSRLSEISPEYYENMTAEESLELLRELEDLTLQHAYSLPDTHLLQRYYEGKANGLRQARMIAEAVVRK